MSLGWKDRRGASDLGNQFHYFRLTRDSRILWGGYDAVYRNGGRIHEEQAQRPRTVHGGRLAYAAGYTGLGVGATRFAAQVLLDSWKNPVRNGPA